MNTEFIPKHAVLTQIAEVIGHEATLSLVTAFGGLTIWPSAERLSPVIGKETAALLASELRGAEIYIPSCRLDSLESRNARLLQKFDNMTADGVSARRAVATLAIEFKISDRMVWIILKRVANEAN